MIVPAPVASALSSMRALFALAGANTPFASRRAQLGNEPVSVGTLERKSSVQSELLKKETDTELVDTPSPVLRCVKERAEKS